MRTFNKNSFDYSSVLNIVVDMKPVDVRAGPLKTAGRRRSSIVNKPPDSECVFCLENVSFTPHIHCLECKRCEVNVCVPCFQMGAELGEHKRGHNYEVIYRCGPPVFETAPDEGPQWGILEEQRLLSLIRAYKVEDWPKTALAEFGLTRTIDEALAHFNRCFLNGPISEIVLEGMIRPPIHAFGLAEAEIYTGEFFKPISIELIRSQIKESLEKLLNSAQLMNTVEYNELPAIRPVKYANDLLDEHLENMICEFSHIHVEHSPFIPHSLPFSYPRCFIQDRLTHLHKAPKGLQLNGRQLNNCTNKMNDSKHKPHALNFFEEEDLDEDSYPFSKLLLDNHHEADEGSPTARYALRGDKRQRNSIQSNGILPKLNESNFSPSPPSSPHTKGSHCVQETPKHREKKEDVEIEDDHPKERGTKRHRLSSSPSKSRRRSVGRKKRRKTAFHSNRRMAKARRRIAPNSNAKAQLQQASNQRRLVKRHSQRQLESSYFSKEKILAYRLTHNTLNFVHRHPPLLTKQQIKKFDSDDLNLIAYNPKRDDFEHEYRNAAEHFISKIFLNGECLSANELEQFKNAVRVARVQRYNRILERRFANHAIIRDHQLLNEFFSIVKSNVNERGKYNVFSADSFPSRKRADDLRPYFAKLRRVMPNNELTDFAEDIAEIESLMARIKMLRGLQTTGITEIKGRLKSELTTVSRNRKRKVRKADNGELRRAGLRWERIKRWSKKVSETI